MANGAGCLLDSTRLLGSGGRKNNLKAEMNKKFADG